MRLMKYVDQRNGIYRVRIKIPDAARHAFPDLPKSGDYARSLKTRNEAEAFEKAPPIIADILRRIEEAMNGRLDAPDPPRPQPQWPAFRRSELLEAIARWRFAAIRIEHAASRLRLVQFALIRIQLIVLEVFESCAVEIVSTTLGDDGDNTAAGTAILRVVGVRLDFEFLNRLSSRNADHGVFGADVRDTVEQYFVCLFAAAVDRDTGRAADIERTQVPPRTALNDAGCRPGNLERITALRRDVGDDFVREDLRTA